MANEIQIREVARRHLAVARARVSLRDVGSRIGGLFAEVYGFLQGSTVKKTGDNVVLYWDEEDKGLIMTDAGRPGRGRRRGRRAVRRRGPCRQLCHSRGHGRQRRSPRRIRGAPRDARAVRRWCAEHGRAIAGPNWEIYGDWSADPEKLRTEVLYLLK